MLHFYIDCYKYNKNCKCVTKLHFFVLPKLCPYVCPVEINQPLKKTL